MESALNANDRPSLFGRGLHRMASFLVAACIGIAATLAWQSQGSVPAKQIVANFARQQGWELPAKILAPRTDRAVGQAGPPAQGSTREVLYPQAAAATPIAPTTAFEEVQQLEAMATRYLAAVRQNVEQLITDQKQLATDQKQMVADQKQVAARQEQMDADQKQVAARQEQMARDIADLRTAVQNIQNKISAPAPRHTAPTQPRRARPQ